MRRGLLAFLLMICAGCSSLAGGRAVDVRASSDRQALLVTWVRDGDQVSGTIQQAKAAEKS